MQEQPLILKIMEAVLLIRGRFYKLKIGFRLLVAFSIMFFGGLSVAEARFSPNDLKDIKNQGEAMKILILGANGSVAQWVIDGFLQMENVSLKLYLRNAKRLSHLQSKKVEIIEGDVLDKARLESAMQGVDIVYANLAGDLESMARAVVESMQKVGLKRLI